jgi:hypothetical protein
VKAIGASVELDVGERRTAGAFGSPAEPYERPAVPEGNVNVIGPDSRLVKGMRGWLQGYLARPRTRSRS